MTSSMGGSRNGGTTVKATRSRQWIYRHAPVVRLAHWTVVVCVAILLMSGLQIFNAHPALYWGNRSDFERPILAMVAEPRGDHLAGAIKIFGHAFDTTGILGASRDNQGQLVGRGFPTWVTLPSYQDLATGRRWHFFFAWILVLSGLTYLVYSFLGGHVFRDLTPSRDQLRHIGRSILHHLRLQFPHGEEAKHYNVLQKLSYLFVIFILFPAIILSGLTMSPGIDAALPELLTVFGGRQSARTIHFIAAFLLVGFALIHILMVLVSGVWNNIRSMITGNYAVATQRDSFDAK